MPDDFVDILRLMDGRANEAAAYLRLVSEPTRLLALCHVAAREEVEPGTLALLCNASPASLATHLAALEEAGVLTRRDGWVALADRRAGRLVHALKEIFCPDLVEAPSPG